MEKSLINRNPMNYFKNYKNTSLERFKLSLFGLFFIFLVSTYNPTWSQKTKPMDSLLREVAVLNAKVNDLQDQLSSFYVVLSDSLKQVPEKINLQLTTRNEELTSQKVKLEEEIRNLNAKNETLSKDNLETTNLLKEQKDKNEKSWKSLAESTLKNSSTISSDVFEMLRKYNTDQEIIKNLNTFKLQSDYLIDAQKFLYEGIGTANYLTIRSNLNQPIEAKYAEQLKVQKILINEMDLFDLIARDLNFLIKNSETIGQTLRTTYFQEKYGHSHEIEHYPWLASILESNKKKYTELKIIFE
jgi:cell division protein FtsB